MTGRASFLVLVVVGMIVGRSFAEAQTIMPNFSTNHEAAKGVIVTPWTCNMIGDGDVTLGSGYPPGKYLDVPLVGGTGTNARADFTVGPSGSVSNLGYTSNGQGFTAGDVLTAPSLPKGGGFTLTVKHTMDFHEALWTKKDTPKVIPSYAGVDNPCVALRANPPTP